MRNIPLIVANKVRYRVSDLIKIGLLRYVKCFLVLKILKGFPIFSAKHWSYTIRNCLSSSIIYLGQFYEVELIIASTENHRNCSRRQQFNDIMLISTFCVLISSLCVIEAQFVIDRGERDVFRNLTGCSEASLDFCYFLNAEESKLDPCVCRCLPKYPLYRNPDVYLSGGLKFMSKGYAGCVWHSNHRYGMYFERIFLRSNQQHILVVKEYRSNYYICLL